jgi:hypothetical protein
MQFDDRVKKAVEAETSFAKRLQEIGQSPALHQFEATAVRAHREFQALFPTHAVLKSPVIKELERMVEDDARRSRAVFGPIEDHTVSDHRYCRRKTLGGTPMVSRKRRQRWL